MTQRSVGPLDIEQITDDTANAWSGHTLVARLESRNGVIDVCSIDGQLIGRIRKTTIGFDTSAYEAADDYFIFLGTKHNIDTGIIAILGQGSC